MKIFAIYASQYFNFSFVDKKYSAHQLPMLHIGMSHTVPLEVRLTEYIKTNKLQTWIELSLEHDITFRDIFFLLPISMKLLFQKPISTELKTIKKYLI